MSQEQVTEVLGGPNYTSQLPGDRTKWHYQLLVNEGVIPRTGPYYVIFKDNRAVEYGVDYGAMPPAASAQPVYVDGGRSASDALNDLSRTLSKPSPVQPPVLRQPIRCQSQSNFLGTTTECY
jgi:hypothetical protein